MINHGSSNKGNRSSPALAADFVRTKVPVDRKHRRRLHQQPYMAWREQLQDRRKIGKGKYFKMFEKKRKKSELNLKGFFQLGKHHIGTSLSDAF